MAQGTYDTLMAVLCALILLLGIPVVTKTWPRIWRGDDDHFRITYTHGNWLWGKVTWRATVRASV